MAEHRVEIAGDHPQAAALRVEAGRLIDLVAGRAEAAGRGTPLELSVLLTDDTQIAELNTQWRGKREPTDVLSFAMEEGPVLGDVVISVQTAERRIKPGEWTLLDELTFLLIHGVLHLLGHDHIQEQERAVMESAEQAIWTALGRPGRLREPGGQSPAVPS